MSTYHDDVSDMAEQIIEWWKSESTANREALMDYIHESVDGCRRVILTYCAKECLLESDNDNAGIEEVGVNGFDFKHGIPWSQLAYFAFTADVVEKLDRRGLDVNNPTHDDEEVTS